MATNIIMEPGWTLPVVCSKPTTPATGDPIRFGAFTGIALTDEGEGGNISTETTVYFGPCIVDVPVKGTDGSPSAVAVGNTIFYVDDADPPLSKTASGYFFGFALETVDADATTTIQVMKPATPGGGTLTSGGVGATQLATGAVTAIKLSSTLKTGFIPLDITTVKLINTNAIINTTEGSLPDGNTTPILERVNAATDKAIRLNFAANVVTEIQFPPIPKPPDLDAGADLTFHMMLAKGSNTDNTAVLGVSIWDGVGDSNAGGNTAALAASTLAEYTVALAHANLAAAPGFLNFSVTPGTHANDAIYMYAAWLEYTRA